MQKSGPSEQPPRPLRLSSEPADGAPGANSEREEEATQRVTGCMDGQRTDGGGCVSACQQGRLTFPLPSRAAPAHLRRAPGRHCGRRDGRNGTRPALRRRRVALGREAGHARWAGGSARAGNPLWTQSDRFSRPLPRSLTRQRSLPHWDWAGPHVNQAPCVMWRERRLRGGE